MNEGETKTKKRMEMEMEMKEQKGVESEYSVSFPSRWKQ